MSCLPASPSYYENQTNLFSKHAWQPVLENYRTGHTTNKQTKNSVHSMEEEREQEWQKVSLFAILCMQKKKETNMTFIMFVCTCWCSHLYLCMPPIWHIYIRHEHTLTIALPRPKGTLNVDTVHLPLSLTTVLTPAHLIDCTKSELISLGGREPTHGYLCHSRIDLREGNLPWRV